jgi:hypothetical protein
MIAVPERRILVPRLPNIVAFRRLGDPFGGRLGARTLPGVGGRSGGAAQTYNERILALGPIAYWPLDDLAGVTARDLAAGDGSLDGTYLNAPDLGEVGIGDGSTSVKFNDPAPADQLVNIYSAALNAVFNGDEFTIGTWLRALNAGFWTDGLQYTFFRYYASGANRMYIQKSAGNNEIRVFHRASDNFEIVDNVGQSELTWVHWMWSVSLAADELKVFKNGIQIGPTVNGMGAWVGALNINNTRYGAATNTVSEMQGWLAKGILFDRALNDADALAVGVL